MLQPPVVHWRPPGNTPHDSKGYTFCQIDLGRRQGLEECIWEFKMTMTWTLAINPGLNLKMETAFLLVPAFKPDQKPFSGLKKKDQCQHPKSQRCPNHVRSDRCCHLFACSAHSRSGPHEPPPESPPWVGQPASWTGSCNLHTAVRLSSSTSRSWRSPFFGIRVMMALLQPCWNSPVLQLSWNTSNKSLPTTSKKVL